MKKRLLFVDDEPRVLDGLRRMLRGRRDAWEMTFAPGAEPALTALRTDPFDLVVSDMRMPGTDGAELLTRVRDEFPGVVRIILSGHTERESAVRVAGVAHQFLSKPVDPDELKRTLDRALNLQALLQDETLRAAIGEITALPSLPHLYFELMRLLDDPDASMADITAVVKQDLGMSAKILQMVSSAFFGLPQHLHSVDAAIPYLGVNTLRSLTLTSGVFAQLEGSPDVAGLSLGREQEHAIMTARVAQRILRDTPLSDDAFLAGMLHDVGKLVLALVQRDRLAEALAQSVRENRPLHEVEREIFGVSHATVVAYLLGLWGLPHPVVEAVAFHHEPHGPQPPALDLVSAIHVADALLYECVGDTTPPPPPLDRALITTLDLDARIDRWRDIVYDLLPQRS